MKTAALLALSFLVIGPFAGAQELTKEAKIERLLDAMNADATINQLFDQIKAMTAAQMPPGATPEQPGAHDNDITIRLPANADLDRAMAYVGRIWHRFVDAVSRAQKQMLNKS